MAAPFMYTTAFASLRFASSMQNSTSKWLFTSNRALLSRSLHFGANAGTKNNPNPTPTTTTAPSPPSIYQIVQEGAGLKERITVKGWVRTIRAQKHYTFMEISDGSGPQTLQVVYPTTPTPTNNNNNNKPLPTTGCSVCISGTLITSPKPDQPVELQADSVEVIGGCDKHHYPLQKKDHSSPEFLRDILHLRTRAPAAAATMRIRSTLAWGIHSFFRQEKFTLINTPILTSNDCEGAGELFVVESESSSSRRSSNNTLTPTTTPPHATTTTPVPMSMSSSSAPPSLSHTSSSSPTSSDATVTATTTTTSNMLASSPSSMHFFGKPVYLTVSGQLHLESFAVSMGKVYTFGPTFRAEQSTTPRHLAEFWMLEPEVAFATMTDAMDLAERCIKQTLSTLLLDSFHDLSLLASVQEQQLQQQKQNPQSQQKKKQQKQQTVSTQQPQLADAVLIPALHTPPPPTVITTVKNIIASPFARMTYTQAIDILTSPNVIADMHKRSSASTTTSSSPTPVAVWGDGLTNEQERYLAEVIVNGPVFVTDYPAAIKPFYAKSNQNCEVGKETVQSFDLLVPKIGELIGGSAREDDYVLLGEKMKNAGKLLSAQASARLALPDHGMSSGPATLESFHSTGGTDETYRMSTTNTTTTSTTATTMSTPTRANLDWYLDLRKYGSVPHAGWGLGFERLVSLVTGIENIRDVIPVPRATGTCRM